MTECGRWVKTQGKGRISMSDYSVEQYVADLRAIVAEESDEGAIVARVRPLAQQLTAQPCWIDSQEIRYNEAQGFGIRLLHQEDNHDLAVFLFSWLPDRGTLPHNHKTWAVVVGIDGEEQEVHFRRRDDVSEPGHAELERTGDLTLRNGDITSCMPDDIHSVWNTGQKVSLSLHTYGRHINHTNRSEFHLETNEERPYVVQVD